MDSQKLKKVSNSYLELKDDLLKLIHITIEKEQMKPTILDLELFDTKKSSLSQLFSHNEDIIKNKLSEPSRSLSLHSSKELISWFKDTILQVNQKINSHNAIVNNISKEKKKLITDIWNYIILENKESRLFHLTLVLFNNCLNK